jgi:hypothetical protein
MRPAFQIVPAFQIISLVPTDFDTQNAVAETITPIPPDQGLARAVDKHLEIQYLQS